MSTGERAPIDGVLKLSTDFVYIIFSHSWFQDITDSTNSILLSLHYIPVYACLLDFEFMNENNSNYTQIYWKENIANWKEKNSRTNDGNTCNNQ